MKTYTDAIVTLQHSLKLAQDILKGMSAPDAKDLFRINTLNQAVEEFIVKREGATSSSTAKFTSENGFDISTYGKVSDQSSAHHESHQVDQTTEKYQNVLDTSLVLICEQLKKIENSGSFGTQVELSEIIQKMDINLLTHLAKEIYHSEWLAGMSASGHDVRLNNPDALNLMLRGWAEGVKNFATHDPTTLFYCLVKDDKFFHKERRLLQGELMVTLYTLFLENRDKVSWGVAVNYYVARHVVEQMYWANMLDEFQKAGKPEGWLTEERLAEMDNGVELLLNNIETSYAEWYTDQSSHKFEKTFADVCRQITRLDALVEEIRSKLTYVGPLKENDDAEEVQERPPFEVKSTMEVNASKEDQAAALYLLKNLRHSAVSSITKAASVDEIMLLNGDPDAYEKYVDEALIKLSKADIKDDEFVFEGHDSNDHSRSRVIRLCWEVVRYLVDAVSADEKDLITQATRIAHNVSLLERVPFLVGESVANLSESDYQQGLDVALGEVRSTVDGSDPCGSSTVYKALDLLEQFRRLIAEAKKQPPAQESSTNGS